MENHLGAFHIVLSRVAGPLLALVLAVEAADAAPLPECSAANLRVDWTPESSAQPLEGCISPGQSSVYLFDTPLLEGPESVEVDPKGRALEVARGTHGFALSAPEDMATGETVMVRVRLAGQVSPAGVTFERLTRPE